MDNLSDISLVSRVAVFQDRRAFDALVRKYQSPVRRFFLAQTIGDGQLSDDLAQDTFIKAYTRIASFKGLSGFSTWLYRIAYNVLYDYRRGQHVTEDIDTTAMRLTSERVSDPTMHMDIYQALSMLKADERTCITLQLMDGLPIDKIAEITGMPQGTVKSHLSRGKKQLASYLKENGYGR